jgi:putative hemin transport protein
MMNAEDIRDRFAALRAKGMRHKDAAAAMGLSEGAAVAAHTGTHDKALRATRLRGPWVELLQALELCGPVLALTRNETTVHEKTGVYEKVSGSDAMGIALGEAIDLRLFFSRWHAGFAVSEAAANPGVLPSLSLQFFNAQGVAVHKIFVRDATDRDAFQSVIDSFTAPDEPVVFTAPEDKAVPREDSAIDTGGLSEAWRGMQDTHEFFGLLNKFGVERQQSFRLTEGEFTQRAERHQRPAERSRVRRHADHGVRRQPRLHPDPLRPGGAHRADGNEGPRRERNANALAQRARPRLQPAHARRPHRQRLDRREADQRRRRDIG